MVHLSQKLTHSKRQGTKMESLARSWLGLVSRAAPRGAGAAAEVFPSPPRISRDAEGACHSWPRLGFSGNFPYWYFHLNMVLEVVTKTHPRYLCPNARGDLPHCFWSVTAECSIHGPAGWLSVQSKIEKLLKLSVNRSRGDWDLHWQGLEPTRSH